MKTQTVVIHVVRTLLGALFVFAGGSFFWTLLTGGENHEGAIAMIDAFKESGYMMPLIKGTELMTGVLLVMNRFVPLALVVLAPVVVNIALFHFVLTPGHDTGLSIGLLVALGGLAFAYRDAYQPLFIAKHVLWKRTKVEAEVEADVEPAA